MLKKEEIFIENVVFTICISEPSALLKIFRTKGRIKLDSRLTLYPNKRYFTPGLLQVLEQQTCPSNTSQRPKRDYGTTRGMSFIVSPGSVVQIGG